MEQLTEIERLSFSHMYDSVALLNSGVNPRPDHVALFLNLSSKAVSTVHHTYCSSYIQPRLTQLATDKDVYYYKPVLFCQNNQPLEFILMSVK